MTHDEYEKKKLAILTRYLHRAGRAGYDEDNAADLAPELAYELDNLALEIDPFAPGTGKPDALLKAMGAPAAGGSQHVR